METTALEPNKTAQGKSEPSARATATRPPAAGSMTPPAPGAHANLLRLLLPALLILAAAIPFLFSLRSGFVYDDDVQIVHNTAIRTWSGIRAYIVPTVMSRTVATPINGNYYRPLFYLWLRVNYALFGLNPTAWHVAALLLHLGVTLLVFLLLRRQFDNSPTQTPWIAAAGALIFAIHPVHVESVVWVSGATDSLAALGLLGSLLLWMPPEKKPGEKSGSPSTAMRRLASLACYAAALLAKETAIVLPIMIFVYAFWEIGQRGDQPSAQPLHRQIKGPGRAWPALLQTFPFLGVTALYFAARFAVLHGFRSGTPWISTVQALLTVPRVLTFYVRHLVWPAHLSLFYDLLPVSSAFSAGFLLPTLLLVGIAAAAWLCWRARPDAVIPKTFAWLVVPLVPVLDIALFQREDFAHDRYLYLPVLGLAMLCAALLQSIQGALWSQNRAATPNLGARRILLAAVTIAFGITSASTAVQAQYWRDDLALYTHAMERSKNTGARNNLASLYAKLGRTDEAETMLTALIKDQPDSWLVNYNLGFVNYQKKHFDLAEHYLQRAIVLDPLDAGQYTYLGLTYLRESRYSDAAAQIRMAIARDPAAEGVHLAMGVILEQMGDLQGAKSEFSLEMKYHPGAVAALQINRINKRISPAAPAKP